MKVELMGVKRIFRDKTVLDIRELTLQAGKIYAVLGPNGSGKTTMLRIIAGTDKADAGKILYNSRAGVRRGAVAYMPQNTYLFDLTVLENVMLGIKNNDGDDTELRAKKALSYVGMGDFLRLKARSLSGGEAQRVALARTLVLGKPVILLDEPASATDISGMELVERYIVTTNQNDKATVLFTTHNPSQAARIADEVIMMHRGRVIEQGTPRQVFNLPQKEETKEFLRYWRL